MSSHYRDSTRETAMFRLMRLWRLAAKDLPFLWFALRHPARPGWLWPVAVFIGLYALEPANFAIPALGLVDDLLLVPLILHLVVSLLPTEIRAAFARRMLTTVR
jgi:uncharacterized membrane protein YkvA (DUF1232 family)